MIQISFVFFLLVFLGIGLLSARFAKKTTQDYLVAGKSVPPSLVGLSAVATNNSGFMFTGMIGTTYAMGLQSIWLMVGWIIGDLIVSLISVRAIRRQAEDERVESFGSLLGYWQDRHDKALQRLAGILTIVLLTLYAAGQLTAGSKATSVLLGWPPALGVVIGGAIVLLYSAFGGIRASIWTDVAQSIVMVIGMFVLMALGLSHLGGAGEVGAALQALPPEYVAIFPEKSLAGVILFIVGWLFGGVAVIGQPHIVIRYMCLDNEDSAPRMRAYYYGWFTVFYALTIIVGLLSRLIFQDATQFDQELALPMMAQQFLPSIFAGLILAALFAAAMSTADSIILSCSAALTHDVLGGKKKKLIFAKAMTATVLITAGLFAIYGNRSVFKIVLDAWGLLGSAFVPLVLFLALGKRCSQAVAVTACLTGVLAFLAVQNSPLADEVYAAAPGILAGALLLIVAGSMSPQKRRA
ncbi:MAG: sodium/proline symporter [Verrucomicrobiales bacterium]|jgi:sodium/proline symporter